jgi:hypothetical protein
MAPNGSLWFCSGSYHDHLRDRLFCPGPEKRTGHVGPSSVLLGAWLGGFTFELVSEQFIQVGVGIDHSPFKRL